MIDLYDTDDMSTRVMNCLKKKKEIFLRQLYPKATSFGISNEWLKKFKQ